jgi:TnpA family transposase
LNLAARGQIEMTKVARHWDDITRIAASVYSGEVSAANVMRILQRGGNPTQLGDALAHVGRIFKILHWTAQTDGPQPLAPFSDEC